MKKSMIIKIKRVSWKFLFVSKMPKLWTINFKCKVETKMPDS